MANDARVCRSTVGLADDGKQLSGFTSPPDAQASVSATTMAETAKACSLMQGRVGCRSE